VRGSLGAARSDLGFGLGIRLLLGASVTVWIAGTLATVVGALWLGFMIGRGRRRA
jgi:hypothetical protein